jgi:predicted component of type VI protein secretion system
MLVPVTILVSVALGLVAIVLYFKQASARAPLPEARKPASSSAPAPGRVHWLVGVAGEVKGKAFLVGQRTLTIGRGPENLIQVSGGEVSRVHCQVSAKHGVLQVIDMSSRHGTQVNGRPRELAQVLDGQELTVGDSKFVFRVEGNYHDTVLDRRAADTENFVTTGDMPRERLEETVRAHGGDLDTAARELGVDADVLREVLARRDPGQG